MNRPFCNCIALATAFLAIQLSASFAFCASVEGRENTLASNTSSDQVDASENDSKRNSDKLAFKTGDSTRYIDFQGGDDANNGKSKESPWKHHPWDPNATSNTRQSQGIHTYVFKGGVIYRGALTANAGGLPEKKISLAYEEEWGTGKPIFMATTKISGEWKKCSPEQFPALNPKVASQIWYTKWYDTSEPRTLYQVKDKEIERLVLAREPDWLAWDQEKGDDVKSDWWECQNATIDIEIFINETRLFNKDKSIQFFRIEKNERTEKICCTARITAVEKDRLFVSFNKKESLKIRRATHISSGGKKARINKISGTHDMITRIYDPAHLISYKTYPDKILQGGVVWAEDLTGSRILPAPIGTLDSKEGYIAANFHYNVNGPAQFSRYYIENLPFLLDSPGEFYFSKKKNKLFVRLKDDQNPNTAHLETGKENVILAMKDMSFIKIDNLHFAGTNEIPITEGSSEYWRGGLYNSAIQISGNASHISVSNCTFSNLPNGIISFCSNRPGAERIEHIVVDKNHFENIGGSAVTLSAISRLPANQHREGKTCRLSHATLLNNTVKLTGQRRISLWGFDHALCLADAELSEVAHNTTIRTAGAGVIVFAPLFYNQYGEHPQLDVPVQRNLIHHNRVEDSLLSLQDYGGIAYWHGGPAYIYDNVSINPVGYKHTHYRRKQVKRGECYRSSCFGIGIYADHGYKVYAYNNTILGKTGDCRKQFYNSCGWNEAAGFLNTLFNNRIDHFAIPVRKGMTESNRSFYIGNTLTNAYESYFRIDAKHVEFDTLAFSGNTLEGNSKMVATGQTLGSRWKARTLAQWRARLKKEHAISYKIGAQSPPGSMPVPLKNQTSIDNKRVFVPWGVAYPEGEYHFIPYPGKINRIIDTHLYWDYHWRSRETVRTETPRNDLIGVNVTNADFVEGALENWNRGALRLNGNNQYVKATTTKLFHPRRNKWIAEFYFKPMAPGPLCRKVDTSGIGYYLNILRDGNLCVYCSLNSDYREMVQTVKANLLDKKYHHLLVEVDHTRSHPCQVYVDGRLIELESKPFSAESGNDCSGYFLIGYDGNSYLPCEIDYFRFALGTFAEAETNIEALHDWQFGVVRAAGS